MTRILIVDDHVSVQESLSTAFDAQEDFAVVGTCSSAAYAPLYCEKLQPAQTVLSYSVLYRNDSL